jgi:uncharacterized protein YjiS (DUF1127 family)
MRRLLAKWVQGFVQARQRRAAREVLMHLDAHTLKDIGVESWNSELAAQVHARRQQHSLRLAAARIGAY